MSADRNRDPMVDRKHEGLAECGAGVRRAGRRRWLELAAGLAAAGGVGYGLAGARRAWAQQPATVAGSAWPEPLRAALVAFTGGRWPQELRRDDARLLLDVAPLVDNGNAVPVTLAWALPTPRCEALALFAERNPLPEMVQCRFGPAAPVTRLSTRVRLATTQRLLAVAHFGADGPPPLMRTVEVVVTLASCVEGET